jgi:hypothetical protein
MSVIERETKAIEAVEEELQSLIPDGPYEEWHADQAGEIVSRVFEAIGYRGPYRWPRSASSCALRPTLIRRAGEPGT